MVMRFLLGVILLMSASLSHAACTGLHNYQFTSLQGQSVDLCNYQDKPILVVNTASKCGFTPQFSKLEDMYVRYRDKGLLIIGFPSNDFKQELTSNKEIGDFCKMTYAVNFPMAGKSSVIGPHANLLYKELAAVTREAPMWNFHKYLILPNGKVYAFNSDVEPESAQIMHKLKPFLK